MAALTRSELVVKLSLSNSRAGIWKREPVPQNCILRHFPPGASSGTRSSTGRKVSAAEMKQVTLQPTKFHGKWNYIITPRAK
jgi:hypothetical protein